MNIGMTWWTPWKISLAELQSAYAEEFSMFNHLKVLLNSIYLGKLLAILLSSQFCLLINQVLLKQLLFKIFLSSLNPDTTTNKIVNFSSQATSMDIQMALKESFDSQHKIHFSRKKINQWHYSLMILTCPQLIFMELNNRLHFLSS
jgi:hypothetical protein